MIFGSAMPLSSKWWCTGAILKTRRPVSLKDATWIITESASARNTPWMMALTTSFLEKTASPPSAPPSASEPMSPMKTLAR